MYLMSLTSFAVSLQPSILLNIPFSFLFVFSFSSNLSQLKPPLPASAFAHALYITRPVSAKAQLGRHSCSSKPPPYDSARFGSTTFFSNSYVQLFRISFSQSSLNSAYGCLIGNRCFSGTCLFLTSSCSLAAHFNHVDRLLTSAKRPNQSFALLLVLIVSIQFCASSLGDFFGSKYFLFYQSSRCLKQWVSSSPGHRYRSAPRPVTTVPPLHDYLTYSSRI